MQVVTSAFRAIPSPWATLPNLTIVVSIDGLQPEHDVRRKPATYERILRNIQGHHVTVHCTVTSAMVKRSSYIPEFVELWAANPSVAKIWMSIFTPQRGASNVECLTQLERRKVVETLLQLRQQCSKLDMPRGLIQEFMNPPASPQHCIFARTTHILSADLKTKVSPCQFGGDPDCSQCGCIPSMGLAAIGNHKVAGSVTAGDIFWASTAIGEYVQRGRTSLRRLLLASSPIRNEPPRGENQLKIVSN